MDASLRVKVRVQAKTQNFDTAGKPTREDIQLVPVDGNVTGASDENKDFAQRIMSGHVQLALQGDAIDKLMGREFYVDFIPA